MFPCGCHVIAYCPPEREPVSKLFFVEEDENPAVPTAYVRVGRYRLHIRDLRNHLDHLSCLLYIITDVEIVSPASVSLVLWAHHSHLLKVIQLLALPCARSGQS